MRPTRMAPSAAWPPASKAARRVMIFSRWFSLGTVAPPNSRCASFRGAHQRALGPPQNEARHRKDRDRQNRAEHRGAQIEERQRDQAVQRPHDKHRGGAEQREAGPYERKRAVDEI